MKRQIVLIVHNVRSCHNVGSLLRTADGLGVHEVYLTGYTPFPEMKNDLRLPHLRQSIARKIHKTALGAENNVKWFQSDDIQTVIADLKAKGLVVAALEQAPLSKSLTTYQPPQKVALIIGREVEGIEKSVLDLADLYLEIPMFGQKESFNVAEAAAMALYHCRFSE